MSDLTRLISAIRSEHALASSAADTAVEHAHRCGTLLLEAKQTVGHGAFGKWLAENFPGSERTAQDYMRVAKRELPNPQRAADMSIRGALAGMAKPGPKAKPIRKMAQPKSDPPPAKKSEPSAAPAPKSEDKVTDFDRQVRDLHDAGLPTYDIAKALDTTKNKVTHSKRSQGLMPSREHNPIKSLTDNVQAFAGMLSAALDLPSIDEANDEQRAALSEQLGTLSKIANRLNRRLNKEAEKRIAS